MVIIEDGVKYSEEEFASKQNKSVDTTEFSNRLEEREPAISKFDPEGIKEFEGNQ